MRLNVLNEALTVCRLAPDTSLPDWLSKKRGLVNVTWTDDELSIVAESSICPDDIQQEAGWRAFKVEGPLDFSLTGILSSLAVPLAEAGVSIFAISTFDTDYLLVKTDNLEKAIQVLTLQGHEVVF